MTSVFFHIIKTQIKERSKSHKNVYCTAAEISSSGLDGVKKDNTNKEDSGDSVNEKDTTSSSPEDINTTHIKSRLQNLQSELSSVLHSLRSNPDEVVTSKVTFLEPFLSWIDLS